MKVLFVEVVTLLFSLSFETGFSFPKQVIIIVKVVQILALSNFCIST